MWLALLALPGTALSTTKQDYRAIYQQALASVRKGQFSRSKTLQQQLGDYPLAPYVEYHRINNSIRQTSPAQIDTFRARYAELPVTKLLYSRWLKDQGKRRNWQTLVQRRYDTSNAELACYFVRASTVAVTRISRWMRPRHCGHNPNPSPRPVTRFFPFGAAQSVSVRTLFGNASAAQWRLMNECLRVTCNAT